MSQAQSLGKTPRQSQYDINPLLLHRWSPRAMSGGGNFGYGVDAFV